MKGRRGRKDAGDSDKTTLKAEVIAKHLSDFTFSEEKQGMQFMKLDLSSKKLDSLNPSLLKVSHLRFIDLSNNNITDVSILKDFPNLIHLNLNGNKIKNLSAFSAEEGFGNLRKLELANNKITELAPITTPKLEYFDITDNKIEKYEGWTGHQTIRVFKAVDNKFKGLNVIKDMPALEEAYLANNPINAFNGYENNNALKVLHLRKTKIDKIEEELPELPELEYLNLRETKISTLDNLKNVSQFPNLKDLNILQTPLEVGATSLNILMAEVIR